MPSSLRQQIIDAVDARLKTITIANSYETNLGNKVFHFKETAFEEADLPGLNYKDVSDVPEDLALQLYLHTIGLEVQAYAIASTTVTVEEMARKLRADIEKAVGTDLTWGGLAEDTRQVGVADDIDMEHKEKKIAGVLLEFEIEYTSNRFDPYV